MFVSFLPVGKLVYWPDLSRLWGSLSVLSIAPAKKTNLNNNRYTFLSRGFHYFFGIRPRFPEFMHGEYSRVQGGPTANDTRGQRGLLGALKTITKPSRDRPSPALPVPAARVPQAHSRPGALVWKPSTSSQASRTRQGTDGGPVPLGSILARKRSTPAATTPQTNSCRAPINHYSDALPVVVPDLEEDGSCSLAWEYQGRVVVSSDDMPVET